MLIQFDIYPAYPDDQNEDCDILNNWCELNQLRPNGSPPADAHGTYVGHTVLRGVLNATKTAWVSPPQNISASNGHKNMRFINNYVFCSDTNGISGQGFWGGEISRNKFVQRVPTSGTPKKPTINMAIPATALGVVRTGAQFYAGGFAIRDNTTYASQCPSGAADVRSAAVTSGNVLNVTSENTNPPGWVTLTKSGSTMAKGNRSFRATPGAATGNVGRYRSGWSTFLTD